MRGLLVSTFVLAQCVTSVFAQTASDLERTYGKSLNVFSVTEHIWMTPEYAADGRICSMRLYPKWSDQKTSYVCSSCKLNSEELKLLLNQLVPPGTRGLQNDSFGQTATGGPAAWTTYEYENVTFTFVSPFGPRAYDPNILKKGEFTFSVSPEPAGNTRSRVPTDDDFSSSLSGGAQIVIVRWTDRKCELN